MWARRKTAPSEKPSVEPSLIPCPAAASSAVAVFRVFVWLNCFLYVSVYVHRPIRLFADAQWDDRLFINLGRSLAQGQWLGHFNQFTLMKGPGYPFFLAASSWLGLSSTAAQAAFYCASVGFFAWVVVALSGSRLLGTVIFVVTLWHPASFAERITRDAIYPGQVLLVLGLTCLGLSRANPGSSSRWAALAGFSLGWFWLTREEGVWILPGLAVLLLPALIRSWRARVTDRHTAGMVGVMAAVFFATQLLFRTLNWCNYGEAVGLDIKERNFVAALDALQSVVQGSPVSHVPVTRATRKRIYSVSPAFASLRGYLDPPSGAGWQGGCSPYPWTCGDIAGGWFIWALREAAAGQGHYQSPAHAARFFGRLSSEIADACRSGKLRCRRMALPYLPQLSSAQLKEMPTSATVAAGLLALEQPPIGLDAAPSLGSADQLKDISEFLGFPSYAPSADVPVRMSLSGWYRTQGDEWFDLQVTDRFGPVVPTVSRMDSPDLVSFFRDHEAKRQRFRIEALCTSCELFFRSGDRLQLHTTLGALEQAKTLYFPFPGGGLNFDKVAREGGAQVPSSPQFLASRAIRAALLAAYQRGMATLLAVGLASMVVAAILAFAAGTSSDLLTLAAAAWILIASRVAIIVLVDVSSFPAINTMYLAPAFSLCCVAPILSLAAALSGAATLRSRSAGQGSLTSDPSPLLKRV